MIRIFIGIVVMLLVAIAPGGAAAKNRPAGSSVGACFSDSGSTSKQKGTPNKEGFASCCYDDGCWSCTQYQKADGSWDADCSWLPAPLSFPQRKYPQFNRSDTLDPGRRSPRKQYEAPPAGGTDGVLVE